MKDIDFDELDRAVSSLMKNVPAGSAPVTDEDDTKVVTLGDDASASTASAQQEKPAPTPQAAPLLRDESELSRVQHASEEQEVEAEAAAETETALEQPTPATAPTVSRGRFMDVVRPSNRDARRPFPASAVSRQGATLQPSVSARTVIPEATEATDEPETSFSQSEPEASTESYDNLSFTDFDTPAENDAEDTTPAPVMTFPEAEAADSTAPLSSPFLPDAKVEKRPLGRPAETAPAVDLAAELEASAEAAAADPFGKNEDTVSPNKDAQLPEQPLPAELGSELLSIETGADTMPQEAQPAAPTEAEQPVATPAPEPEPVVPAQAPVVAPEPVAAAPATRAMEVTSIPQQYKVQTTQNEAAPAGTIYDAQPLAHPAKKKPGWLWIVAILVILLLGAGSGAAVYYLGLL